MGGHVNFLNGLPASLAPSAASPALAVSPKATIFVALPRAAWAPCGVCICSHCKGRVGYWDTLAVSTRDGTTWTVHRPEANPHHDEVDGRRWTAPATVVLAAQARAGELEAALLPMTDCGACQGGARGRDCTTCHGTGQVPEEIDAEGRLLP